jgi:hypothetical protein
MPFLLKHSQGSDVLGYRELAKHHINLLEGHDDNNGIEALEGIFGIL